MWSGAKNKMSEQPYPTRNGVAINPLELDLPQFDGPENIHHGEWTKSAFAALALFQTFRDLERHQFVLPIRQHNFIHAHYGPPEMPTVGQAMNVVIEALDAGERLRRGSVGRFELVPVTTALIKQIKREYNENRG